MLWSILNSEKLHKRLRWFEKHCSKRNRFFQCSSRSLLQCMYEHNNDVVSRWNAVTSTKLHQLPFQIRTRKILWNSDKRSEETNASWIKEHMTSNVFGCPHLWFQTHKGGPMSITMCIIETCRGEQVRDREGSHLQCRFSLEQTWWSLCSNSPTDFHKERCGQKLWMMVGNITRSRDRRASCYGKSISRLWDVTY